MKKRKKYKSNLKTEMMKTKSTFTDLLVHVLQLFGILKPLLCQATSELISTNMTATINSPVTFQCLVHNPHLTLWLLQRRWCGYSSALTLGEFNFKNETFSLNIGDEIGLKAYNLIVNHPSKEIEGTYSCQERGTNKAISTLHVDTDRASEKNINVPINTEVELRCIVYHHSFAVWIFMKDEGSPPISLSAGEKIFNKEDYSLNINNGSTFVIYNLTINAVKTESEGIYVCKEEGIARVIFKLNTQAFSQQLTVAVGTTVKMHCVVDDYRFALWVFVPSGTKTPVTLSSADQTFDIQSYTLIMHDEDGVKTYDLIINNTAEQMEGVYSCREQGISKVDVTLKVEVPPDVWIEKDGSRLSSSIDVTMGDYYDFTCIASGGKPSGLLSWELNHKNLSNEVAYQKAENEVSSVLHYTPAIVDTQLTCIFNGQIAVPSIKVALQINVLYLLYCNLSTSVYSSLNVLMVHCTCDGNPEVSSFYIFVNNSLHYTDRVNISSKYPASLNCFAENVLGQLSNKPTYQYQPSPNQTKEVTSTPLPDESKPPIVWVITFLSFILIVLCSLLVIIVFRKKRHVSSSYFTWEPTVSSRVAVTLSDRPPCRSPATEHRFFSHSSEYYETVPNIGIPTESDGISTDERVEYNAQYFELPINDSEEKIYDTADNQDKEDICTDTNVVSRASSKSSAESFSDAEYFGPLSEGGTLDKKIGLLDAKYKVNMK